MKKTLLISLLSLSLCSCYAGLGTSNRVPGLLYADYIFPEEGGGAIHKVGTAVCKTYFGLVALGDCSIRTAAKNGGITDVGSVSSKHKNILGVYAEYTTVVTGK